MDPSRCIDTVGCAFSFDGTTNEFSVVTNDLTTQSNSFFVTIRYSGDPNYYSNTDLALMNVEIVDPCSTATITFDSSFPTTIEYFISETQVDFDIG